MVIKVRDKAKKDLANLGFKMSMNFFTDSLFANSWRLQAQSKSVKGLRSLFGPSLETERRMLQINRQWECNGQRNRAASGSRIGLSTHSQLNGRAFTLQAVGIGFGFKQSAWGLHLPELNLRDCACVDGNPIVAELAALEFGLRQTLERHPSCVIVESGSPLVLDLLRHATRGEPDRAKVVRKQLGLFQHVQFHLVGFENLEDARACCRNVAGPLAIIQS